MTTDDTDADRMIGRNLKRLRKARRFTLAQLAAQVGVSFATVHKWESGTSRMTAVMLFHLSRALGSAPSAFFMPNGGAAQQSVKAPQNDQPKETSQ